MPGPISIGDEAPNFDLSSTEDAAPDAAGRGDPHRAWCSTSSPIPASERVQRDLDALNRGLDDAGAS